MSNTFVELVAHRSENTVDDVRAILSRHNIVDSPTPPISRPLRLKHLKFSGEKDIHGEHKPFAFDWEPKQSGINVIASDENFAGKSTVFQTMLWALRGEPKSLTATTESWIRKVEACFQAGDRHVRVRFDVEDRKPIGSVDLLHSDESVIHSLSFSSEEAFKSQMNSVMLEALDLEPIAASREVPTQDKTVMYSDGWTSYTGAFLFDGESGALIGENVGNNLPQRLLQVFLGIPWATTQFQARAAWRVADSLVKSRKRKLSQLGNQSVEQMQARLREIADLIANGSARDSELRKLDLARKKYEHLSSDVSRLKAATTVVDAEVIAGKQELLQKQRSLLAIEEEMAASRFLGKLSPTCCPRCTQSFAASRVQKERTSGECSVCLTPVDEGVEIDFDALKTSAVKDIEKLQRALNSVTKESQDLKQKFQQARRDLENAAEDVAKLSTSGTALDEQKLRLEAARTEGMLDAVSKLVETDTGEQAELAVLAAADECAKELVTAAAEDILRRSSTLIRALVTRLGMRDVEEVSLKRNAHVDIRKGGSESNFGRLSAGERLRVRIATVIALLQASKQFGAGRHPGLLVIDSPAKEEMADANVEEMLEALSELAEDVDVQLFVAFRGTGRALKHFPRERCLLAEGKETLW